MDDVGNDDDTKMLSHSQQVDKHQQTPIEQRQLHPDDHSQKIPAAGSHPEPEPLTAADLSDDQLTGIEQILAPWR